MLNKQSAEPVFPLMFEFGRLMRREAGLKADCEGLTLPQLEVLTLVSAADDVSMSDVAAGLRITAPSATALVDELVSSGLLERGLNPEDRREVRVHLTAQGKKSFRTIVARKEEAVAKVLGVLKREEREQFMRILRAIVAAHK